MKYTPFIFYIFLLNSALLSQAPDTLWTRTFGGNNHDWGNSVQQTSDGGYIIIGNTSSFGAGAWLIKTDANGDTVWTKTFGGTNEVGGESVRQTADGGYIITGYSYSISTLADVLLIRTDQNGNTLWTKTYGDSGDDYSVSVDITTDGGYIIAGCKDCGQVIFCCGDVWLIRTDANGDTVWTKTFGGDNGEMSRLVQRTSDDGFILVGTTNSFGVGSSDVWLIKTDTNGDTLWTKTYGGNEGDWGNSVQQTSDGGYIITGLTRSFGVAGSFDVWLIKTDTNGDTLWTKTFGGVDYDRGESVQQTNDEGYIIIGSTESFGANDDWLIKTDAGGDTLWTKIFGGGHSGRSVQQTADGGYIVLKEIDDSFGNNDIWLIKVAPDVTSIDESSSTEINDYHLSPNYPNPFNPSTTIEFILPQSGFVSLKVHNILGEEVATLLKAHRPAGQYAVNFDASGFTSGIYYYTLTVDDFKQTRKMVLLR